MSVMQVIESYNLILWGDTEVVVRGPHKVLSVITHRGCVKAQILMHNTHSSREHRLILRCVRTHEPFPRPKEERGFMWLFVDTFAIDMDIYNVFLKCTPQYAEGLKVLD